MTTWYRVDHYFEIRIKAVDMVKTTDKTITYFESSYGNRAQRRSHLRSTDATFFPTWDEAVAFAREATADKVKRAEMALANARANVEAIEAMTAPGETL